jgi:phosphoesterase RecJ-like protein
MSPAERASTILRTAQSICLIVHHHPDGDAIGSAVALQRALGGGTQVRIISSSAVPSVFTSILGPIETESLLPTTADAYVIVDCAELHRTGFPKQIEQLSKGRKPLIVIDHHKSGDLARLAQVYISNSLAAATAELVFGLLTEMRIPITPEIATPLLLGIYTDTGGFHHQTTSATTLRNASRLVRLGGELNKISQGLCRELSRPKQRLWGKILSEISINKLGIVVAQVKRSHLKEAQSTIDDVAGLANLLALTSEAKLALVLIETESGWRGILRTRHRSVNLGRLARLLGGSGHKKAAGFMTTKDIFSGKIERS